MPDLMTLTAPITYITKGAEAEGDTRYVYGPVSDSSLDIDLQRANPDWLKSALAEWWQWRNVQANHNGPDVGVGVELTKSSEGDGWDLLSKVVDPVAIRKLDEHVFNAYSIGIRWPKLSYKDASAPGGTIIGGKIVHVALCGRPANDRTRISVGKSPNAEDFVIAKSAYADVPDSVEAVEEAEQIIKAASDGPPFDGTHTHDHPAFGSHGDDASHDGYVHSDGKSAQSELNKAAPTDDASAQAKSDQGYDESDGPFADPKNKRWPMNTKGRTRTAMAYYNAGKGKEGHTDAEWSAMGGRIASRASDVFGGKYSVVDGKVQPSDSGKEASASDEITDTQLARQASDLITQLIAREASEIVGDDDTDDLYDVDTLRMALGLLQDFIRGEAFEAAMLGLKSAAADVPSLLLRELNKAGARNSAADRDRIQAIHDHAGDLGASPSDNCQANASGGDGDMDEKTARALIQSEISEAMGALPKAVEDALTAAGVTPDLIKSATAVGDVGELVKGAVAPLEERLTAVENRAEDGGPLIMAVQRGLLAQRVSSEKAALTDQADSLRVRSLSHPDPTVRAEALREYSRVRTRLEEMAE